MEDERILEQLLGAISSPSREEIRAAGFNIDPRRVVAECVSGSVAAKQRAGFTKLLDRLEDGDVLIVTKLDRLDRNDRPIATKKVAAKQPKAASAATKTARSDKSS